MSPHAFVGIDVGTSGCKGALLEGGSGRASFTASFGYPTRHGLDGAETQRAEDWLTAVRCCLTELAAIASGHGAKIGAIGVTGPAHGAVLVGDKGVPVAPVMLPYDTRSAATAERLALELGHAYFDRTFVRLGPSWTIAQLAWLRRAAPQLGRDVHRVLVTKDFVTWSLTGEASTDRSDAAGTGLYDQVRSCWDEESCTAAGVDRDQLPPVVSATAMCGYLSSRWAAATGIESGTPVTVGATDTSCELVSLGLECGGGLVKIGSTGTVVVVLDEPRPDPRVMTYPLLERRWYAVAATNAAAAAYRWLQEAILEGGRDGAAPFSFAAMDALASSAPPGSQGLLFLPFLTGERGPYWDSRRRAAFVGLSTAHRRAELCRAVLEGVAFSLRECRDLMSQLGIRPQSMPYYTGGGITSQLWRSVLASVLGETGLVAEPHGPSLGAAMLATYAMTGAMPKIEYRTEPVGVDHCWRKRYDALYMSYRAAASALAAVDHALVASMHRAEED